jgi:catechol 2,3-dioxygenase-like lactoylglutathione lyase family enzyme
MIDHTGVAVTDYAHSKRFYDQVLGAIGYALLMEVPKAVTGSSDVAGFGEPPKPDFWIHEGKPGQSSHIAFRVESRQAVDAFHKAGRAAGGRDNGAPGIRAHYHPNYYGAFVLDPDGHNIEAVCHNPA